ncbi:MAG: YncE family protein [Sandaracinaceae bacterium]|nr:YncE family protein [Sandaracinaceae bacterium]
MRARLAFVPALVVLSAALLVPAADPCAAGAQRPAVARTERARPRLRVVGRARTGIQPKSVALSPDGRRVWVANFGRPDRENVFVYDAESLERVGSVEFPGNAVELAFRSDGSTAYVSNFREHAIHELDAETFTVRRTAVVGGHPKVITLSPSERRIYVANWATERVTELDAETFEVRRRLRTGQHPRGVALSPDGQRVFVAAMYAHVIHVFDRGAETERTRFTPCNYPRHLLMAPDGARLYASCSCCRQVRWFDPATLRLLGIAQTGENPRTIALSADGRWLVAAGFDDSTVTLVDTVALTHQVFPVPGANQIVGVAVRGGDGPPRIFATSWMTGELYALEPEPE